MTLKIIKYISKEFYVDQSVAILLLLICILADT